MLHLLARYWWTVALRGLLAVLFGLLAIFMPGKTLLVLVLLFGAYSLLDGIFDLVSAVRSPGQHWAFLLEGIVGIIAGVATFVWPRITGMVLLYLIAFWAISTGVFEILSGIRLRKAIANEMFLVLTGILSLLFGILITIFPGAGALAIAFWIGAYALIFGVMMIALAFRLRGFRHSET